MPPALSDFDLHLHGEGNHHHIYDCLGTVHTEPIASHGHPQSLQITLPPLAAVMFKPE